MREHQSEKADVRPRPSSLRALGASDPPAEVFIGDVARSRIAVLKHDTFAATALYQGPAGRVIVKFNRQQAMLGLPMRWLGRALGQRERSLYERLAGLDGIPQHAGDVVVDGQVQRHASAHHYIDGHPLADGEQVSDDFFATLRSLLREVHARDAAHVDLNKRENIIVGDDGKPYLIDYQIHFALPRRGLGNNFAARMLLRILQRSDEYHLLKHMIRLRPDQLPEGQRDMNALRPWWIRLWRCIATPWRQSRRRLLVALKIRSGEGRASSEHEPEAAFRANRD